MYSSTIFSQRKKYTSNDSLCTYTCNKTKNLFQFIYINQIITYVCAVDITCVDNGRVVNVRAIIPLSPNLLTTHTHIRCSDNFNGWQYVKSIHNYLFIYTTTISIYICTKITHTHTRLLTSRKCVFILKLVNSRYFYIRCIHARCEHK